MASSYERKFVFLSAEDKGYEAESGKIPRGHIEIERKKEHLSFKVFVEDMKAMEYQVQLITPKGKQATLGWLLVEDKGKGEEQYNTVSTNVMDTGSALEDFAVIIIQPVGGAQTIKAPLVGWLQGNKFEYKPFMQKQSLEEEILEQPEQKEEEKNEMQWKQEEISQEEYREDMEKIKEKDEEEAEKEVEELEKEEETQRVIEKEEQIQEEVVEEKEVVEVEKEKSIEESEEGKELEKETKEFIELEDVKEIEKEVEKFEELEKQVQEIEEVEKAEDEPVENTSKAFQKEPKGEEYWVDFGAQYPKGKTYQDKDKRINLSSPYYYVNENLEELQKIGVSFEPFDLSLEDHKWWKITGYEKELEVFYLFYNGSFVPLTYPYMGYRNIGDNYIKDNHWLFGTTYEQNITSTQPQYYVYGIPGRFCIQEQPFQGSTGFLYWHPLESNKREKGAMGYWLLYIDARSGAVAVPKRPTMPPVCRDLSEKGKTGRR